jgi:hypothetical protein
MRLTGPIQIALRSFVRALPVDNQSSMTRDY